MAAASSMSRQRRPGSWRTPAAPTQVGTPLTLSARRESRLQLCPVLPIYAPRCPATVLQYGRQHEEEHAMTCITGYVDHRGLL